MNPDDDLWQHVYEDLRRRAHQVLRRERPDHTLNTTALVHEAYAKLSRQDARYQDRAHFLAVAAIAMRRILVNYARDRAAQKRGGNRVRVTLDDAPAEDAPAEDVIAIDEVLDRLAALNERQSRVVVYRFFAGLTDEEIAKVLEVSVPTVRRDWRAARAWITLELERSRGSGG
jgi:RNA polymerase sigma factor (TIGR02999 family)